MEIRNLEDLPGTFSASKNGDNHHIDDIDLKLLELLIENSRISYAELARAVGLSRVGAKNRVNELKKKGIIEKFTILVP